MESREEIESRIALMRDGDLTRWAQADVAEAFANLAAENERLIEALEMSIEAMQAMKVSSESRGDDMTAKYCDPLAKPPIVLSLCDYSSQAVLPWARAGYECWTVDTQPRQAPHDNIRCVTADVMTWLPPLRRYAFVMAWPPCTNLAVSGARWFKEKGLAGLADGLRVVERCAEICEWTGAPWCLENPVSTLSSYWRKPDHTFDPCDYGDPYTKRTCLWTGGGFVMPEKTPVPATLGSKMHLMPPSEDRANKRSETPAGFAHAVFRANTESARLLAEVHRDGMSPNTKGTP